MLLRAMPSAFSKPDLSRQPGCRAYVSNAVRIISTSAADAELEPKKSLSRQPEKAATGGKI
ncbi:hypothetical protein SAMN05216315_11418 [Nitrosospira sp. Nsp18]|nr:hypothetical protein SAMN05216315_11418 [Nitrosospira sp. Nsp18]